MASTVDPLGKGKEIADSKGVQVAIVDYGLGNLFSVRNACERAGHRATITGSPTELLNADVVILPGVGAFGDAMASLARLDLVTPLMTVASSDRPLIGICLGMQLLMTESYEFGHHRGLGIIEGAVVRFADPGPSSDCSGSDKVRRFKVPHVGWDHIFRPQGVNSGTVDPWSGSPLEGLEDGEYMYFVHSFYAQPADSNLVLSVSKYGETEFCSSLRQGNIFACQFHPERSGPQGFHIYRNIAPFFRD